MLAGIIAIREMNARIVRETGFTCAEEILYPEIYRYLSDLLSYAAVGARSVEDQLHRMIASGVGIPVGMKNPPSGDISVMLNSIAAAQHSQEFLFRGWEVRTKGNPLAHAILRGYVDNFGNSLPNYHYEDLHNLLEAYAERKLANPAVVIDTNHANSGKKYLEQIRIAKDVMHSRHMCPDIRTLVNMTSQLSLAISEVDVEYGESLERVEVVIRDNLAAIADNIPDIVEGPYYMGVSKLGSSGVTLRFTAKCPEMQKFQVERDLNRQIKLLFDKYDINIPFTQVVVHDASALRRPAPAPETPVVGVSAAEDATAEAFRRDEAQDFVDEQRALSRGLDDESRN